MCVSSADTEHHKQAWGVFIGRVMVTLKLWGECCWKTQEWVHKLFTAQTHTRWVYIKKYKKVIHDNCKKIIQSLINTGTFDCFMCPRLIEWQTVSMGGNRCVGRKIELVKHS